MNPVMEELKADPRTEADWNGATERLECPGCNRKLGAPVQTYFYSTHQYRRTCPKCREVYRFTVHPSKLILHGHGVATKVESCFLGHAPGNFYYNANPA